MDIGVEKKIINGIKVVYNHNTNKVIVSLSDSKVSEIKDFLKQKENKDAILLIAPTTLHEVYGYTLDINTLDILKEFDLKNILITDVRDINDISGLYTQKNLKILDTWQCEIDLDFSYFSNLEELHFYWSQKDKNLFLCTSLKRIRIWKYKSKNNTLNEFSSLINLEELGVIQSNIVNISGIEKLQRLKKIELSYNLKLEIDFKELGFTLPNIEDLEINTCKKVGLDFIKVFPNVKKLRLVKFQDIEQLKPILDGLPMLEEIFVGETNILESDNTYYTNYKNIRRFFFAGKKHHKLTYRDVEKALGIEPEF